MRMWATSSLSMVAGRQRVDHRRRQVRLDGVTMRRTARSWRVWSLAVLLVAAVGCSSASTPTTPSISPLAPRGEVSDPAGDSPADPRVPVSSDLVHATAEVAAGTVTFVVQLAPGTLDRQATRVVILLDTDQRASTGIRQTDGMGADYALELVSSQASISKANLAGCAARQGCYDAIGTAPITALPDGMQVTVSLASLGNTDGRMTFKLHTYVTIDTGQTLTPIIFDSMPDELLPPGRVQ
jgi:hypothetical protein